MTDSKEPWSNQTVWTSDIEEDKYLILALNINKTTYNDLHDRVLEVRNTMPIRLPSKLYLSLEI